VTEKEAVALFDFRARNEKELSLKKGDTVHLHTRMSSEWWRGSSGGHTGLIPHTYVAVQTRYVLYRLHRSVISCSLQSLCSLRSVYFYNCCAVQSCDEAAICLV